MNILCMTPVKHLDGVYEHLCSMGKVVYEPSIDKKELRSLLTQEPIDCIFTNPNKQGFILDEEALGGSKVRVLNTCSTGTNHIDLNYCKENGVDVWSLTNDYDLINDLPSTSELAVGLLLSLTRTIPKAMKSVQHFEWDYTKFVGRQIAGLKVGCLGWGRLGKIFCKQMTGFGADLYVCDPYQKVEGYRQVSLEAMIGEVDALALHVHVTDETRKMFDRELISKMKRGSYLVNTSRGELVDECAILDAIKSEQLAGYGTDVLASEFGNLSDSPLVEAMGDYNIVVTPHIGGMTIEGQTKAYFYAINKFKRLL